ncbi:hypothetical protein HOL24_04070 [bacterium]|nr:hypothetical protein [bacterium]
MEEIREGLGLELEQYEKPTVKSSSTNKPANKTSTSNNNPKERFDDGRRNDDLFKAACAMRDRGESKCNIRAELLLLNQKCTPPTTKEEVLKIVDNVWSRYRY